MNDSAIYVGPIANALGGADISWIVGSLFAALLYYIGVRTWPALSGERTPPRPPPPSRCPSRPGCGSPLLRPTRSSGA
ncbi:MAG: hypothetical protein ACYDEN_03615 [Acidimicrobiales bacterium]